jgi:hypothetical protein
MSLAELWTSSRAELEKKKIHQIIAFAGAGRLTDGGAAATEFREFLGIVPSSHLARYADECLLESFDGSGFALQDVVNQIGRRLGYLVTDGRYRGTTNQVGFDGLWKFPDGHAVVIEVKTTDTYRIDLQRIANYRRELIAQHQLDEEVSSVLLVIGRQETGDLEAQIRGSRHAWDVRLISIDALLRLMFLKERLDDPATIRRICDILKPREFTRLDEIVDIVFSTAEETAEPDASPAEQELDNVDERTAPAAFHGACIARVEDHFGRRLVRQTRSSYATPDNAFAIVCAVSKTHDVMGHPSYWFSFHPYQKKFLEGTTDGYLILGCGSERKILALPLTELLSWLPDMWTTQRPNGKFYWHIRVHEEGLKYTVDRSGGAGRIDATRFLLS